MTVKLYVREKVMWYCRFDGPDGKEKKVSTEVPVGADRKMSRREAEKAGNEIRDKAFRTTANDVPRGTPRDGVPARPTLSWALEQTWVKTWSRSRSAIVLKHVIRRMQLEVGHWFLDEITHDVIENYVLKLVKSPTNPKGLAPATCNRRTSYIRKALGDAHRSGVLTKLPVMPRREKEKNRKQRYLQPDEEMRILEWFERMTFDDHVDKRPEWHFMRQLVIFLLDSGYRFSEVFKFTLQDRFASLENVEVKNGDDTVVRRIPLTERALIAAKGIMQSSYYVRTEDPEEVAKLWDWCSQRFDRCTAALKINTKQTRKKDRVTLHVLRHTTASRLVQAREPILTVKDWMGHKNINTTLRYAHLAPHSFDTAVSALESRAFVVPESLTCTRSLTPVSESTHPMHSR